jgi:hypothetical protein
VRHYYEEIGFELIGRAQSLSPPSSWLFSSLFHIVLEEEWGGKNLNGYKSSNLKPDYSIWLIIPAKNIEEE